jgi:hypothetical protein
MAARNTLRRSLLYGKQNALPPAYRVFPAFSMRSSSAAQRILTNNHVGHE